MVELSEFDKYLVTKEKAIYDIEPVTVNDESGYKGVVTNKRVIFIKEHNLHEILGRSINSISWEKIKEWRKGALILGILLIVLPILLYLVMPLSTTAQIMVLFPIIGMFIIRLSRKTKEKLVIYGGGRDIRLEGDRKEYLEKFMFNVRNQLMLEEQS